MATSGSVSTSTVTGGHLTFSWSRSNSGTRAIINWKMTLTGTRDGTTTSNNHTVSVTATSGSVSTNSLNISSMSVTVVNGVAATTYKSGSFTLNRNSSGNGGFRISFSTSINGNAVSASDSWSLDSVITYTKCSAPTTFTVSPTTAGPNDKITVTWSGAKGGTNNSISSYRIYWRITSGGTAPSTSTYTDTQDVPSKSTSGSTTVTLSNATDGYKVVFGIVVRGEAGSSYYSSIKTSSAVTIQTTPTLTISATPTLFTALGSNGDSGSRLGWCKNISIAATTNGSGTIQVQGLLKSTSSTTTTWGSISSTVKTNTLSTKTVSSGTTSFSLNIHNAIKAIFSSVLSDTNIIAWRLKITFTNSYGKSATAVFPENTSQYYAIPGIPTTSIIAPLTSGGGSLEDDEVYINNVYHVWNRVKFTFPKDESLPNIKASMTASGKSYTTNVVSDTISGNDRIVEVTIPNSTPSDTTLIFKLNLTDNIISKTVNINKTIKEARRPATTGLTFDLPNNFNPLVTSTVGSEGYTVKFPFADARNDTTLKSVYFIDIGNTSNIKLIGYTTQWGTEYPRTFTSNSIGVTSEGFSAKIIQTDPYQRIFNLSGDYGRGPANYVGTLQVYYRLKMTNIFGNVLYSEHVSKTFNFNYTPTLSDITITRNNTSWESGMKIRKGNSLKFTTKLSYATVGTYTIRLYDNNTNALLSTQTLTRTQFQKTEGAYKIGATESSRNFTYTVPEITVPGSKKYRIEVTVSYNNSSAKAITTELPVQPWVAPTFDLSEVEINKDGNNYKLELSYTWEDYDSTYNLTFNGVRFQYCTYSSGTWSDYASVFFQSYTGDMGQKVIDNTTYYKPTKTSGGFEGVFTSSVATNINGKQLVKIRPRASISITTMTGITTPQTSEIVLPEIIITILTPTVSLRKNQVGINIAEAASIDSNTVLMVKAPDTIKKTTKIDGINSDGSLTRLYYEMDIGKMRLYTNTDGSWSEQHSIDLLNGIFK